MELPNFDPPKEIETPAPRKPRQKPTKSRKGVKKKAVAKGRKARPAKKRPALSADSSSPAVIISAYAWAEFYLKPLSKTERAAILDKLQEEMT